METKRKALGKGLEQLFTIERIDFDNVEKSIVDNATPADIVNIPLTDIRSNPYQPRKTFDEETLEELAVSIKEHGIIEPIIVKKSIKGYEIVAGERRVKASKIAGLKTIPAIIRDFNDTEMMEIALIENIQRENLNPIEEAKAYSMILKNNDLTQDDLAHKFGKSRSYITNLLGILKLPEKLQNKIIENKISMGHARSLSKLEDTEKQELLLNRILKEELSVREIEKIINEDGFSKKRKAKPNARELPKRNYYIFEEVMRDKIGTKVVIKNKKIEIPFDSDKDLERIINILNIKIDKD